MMHTNSIIGTLNQIHNGETHIGEYLSLIFRGSNFLVWWKDKNSIWQGANQLVADFLDQSYPEELIGKNDFDLSSEDSAELYIANDQDVINTGQPKFNIIESHEHTASERFLLHVTKMPVYKNDGIVGTVGFGTVQPYLACCSKNNYMRDLQRIFQSRNNYFLVANNKTFRLTAKQAACLTYLSIGKTPGQIADTLDCSVIVVNEHIDYLKKKLKVPSITKLIESFWQNPIRWF